jgi:hypothetical protein
VSDRSIRRILWLVALLTAPVPFYIGQVELAPVLRLAFFTLLLGSVFATEGGGWMLALWVGLGVVQTAVWTSLLWLAVRLLWIGLRRAPAQVLRPAVALAVVLAIGLASWFPIYDTALSSTHDRSSLLQIFQ